MNTIGILTPFDADDDIVVLHITPRRSNTVGPDKLSQALAIVATAAAPVILELAGTHMQRALIIRCQRRFADMIRGQLTGIYGSPGIAELGPESDPIHTPTAAAGFTVGARMTLARPPALPLRTFRELPTDAGLHALLAPFYGFRDGEASAIQVLIHGPAPDNWAAAAREEMLANRRNQPLLMRSQLNLFRAYALILATGFLALGVLFADVVLTGTLFFIAAGLFWFGWPLLFNHSALNWSETSEDDVERKIAQICFRAEIRITVTGATLERATSHRNALIAAFQAFRLDAGNALVPLSEDVPFSPAELVGYRNGEMFLGSDELATMWHLPRDPMPDLMSVTRQDHTLTNAGDFRAAPDERTWNVGTSRKAAGPILPIELPLSTIADNHVILLGQTRMGKSTTLEHMIAALAGETGRAMVVIDPHGDMVDRLLGLIPEQRVDDVRILDFADTEWLPALNLLDLDLFNRDPEMMVAALKETAHALFGAYWGPRMEVPFDRTLMALAYANLQRPAEHQLALLDAYFFLTMAPAARSAFLREQLSATHPLARLVEWYFNQEFDTLNEAFQQQVISPVLSKLSPFTSNTQLLAIFGQSQSSINPLADVRAGRILLVKTGMATASADYSNFIGSAFLNVVQRGVMMQQRVPPSERTPITLVVDEAQLFSGFDFGGALAAQRKFGGNLFLTSQGAAFMGYSHPGEEPDRPMLFPQVMSNVATRIVFRLAGHDANVLAQTEFVNQIESENLVNLPAYHAFLQFEANGTMHGPLQVRIAPPLAERPGIRAQIMARRSAYLRRVDQTLDGDALFGRLLRYRGTLAERNDGTGGMVETDADAAETDDLFLGRSPDEELFGDPDAPTPPDNSDDD